MTMHFADIARQAAADGAITTDEILALRRAGWANGVMEPNEVDAIFALNDSLAEPSAEWSDFFVEAIGEFVINGTEPKGYVSEDNAAWLIAKIDHDGRLENLTELELLVRIVERGLNVPKKLKDYVLGQIEQTVLTGSGPTRRGELAHGHVNAEEANLLRRVLFAPAGDAPAAVSAKEADLLFRLKDASLGAANAPEWKQLFVQGVANFVCGTVSPTAQITRERAAELEEFMSKDTEGVGGFLTRAARGTRHVWHNAPDAFRIALGKVEERDRFGELRDAEQVTGGEQMWLDGKIAADGSVDEYEQALMRFLAEEGV